MRFQLHSDIHLEKYPHRRIPAHCSTLVLAGDVGVPIYASYIKFFKETSRNFDQIIYILGNHEYEKCWIGIDKNDMSKLDQRFVERNRYIKTILGPLPNVKILDDQYFAHQDFLIFGGTLWSDFKKSSPLTRVYLTQKHKECVDKITHPPDLLITHYVNHKPSLWKPWSAGLGPSHIIPAKNYVFGHIHYSIIGERVNTNPWGEKTECEIRVLDLQK